MSFKRTHLLPLAHSCARCNAVCRAQHARRSCYHQRHAAPRLAHPTQHRRRALLPAAAQNTPASHACCHSTNACARPTTAEPPHPAPPRPPLTATSNTSPLVTHRCQPLSALSTAMSASVHHHSAVCKQLTGSSPELYDPRRNQLGYLAVDFRVLHVVTRCRGVRLEVLQHLAAQQPEARTKQVSAGASSSYRCAKAPACTAALVRCAAHASCVALPRPAASHAQTRRQHGTCVLRCSQPHAAQTFASPGA